MTVTPKIKSFLIADMVIREQGTNKWSAIGIFEKIFANKFPCRHHNLALYIRLTDAEGEYDIRVEFCGDNNQKLALFEGIKLRVKSRLSSPEIGIQTRDLPIPQEGKYFFNLYLNDNYLDGIPIEVVKIS